MALLRLGLAALGKSNVSGSAVVSAWQVLGRSMATGAAPSKADIVHFLDARDDPEVDSAIREYQQAAFKASSSPPEKPEEVGELAAKVQRKYVAAQIVESGIQNVSVPLGWQKEGSAPLKRYTQQLAALGAKAGFEDPVAEVSKHVAERAAQATSAKELLTALQPLTSPDFHAALSEALAAVEAETSASVSLDGSSAGYKKFADRVKKVAEAHKLPWNLLVAAKARASDEVARDYAAWQQTARVTDAAAEIEALKAEAAALLDKHLSKSADTIQKEQAAALANLQKRIENAKGAPWAAAYAKDLEAIAAFDAAVAADPVNGPKVAVA